jgi:hypothetical protein
MLQAFLLWVAEEMTMSGDKNFDRETLEYALTYPSEDLPGLRVYTAKPEYLFAMKCRAMRVGGIETNSDIDDIKLLARAIGLNNSQDALTLVEKFYPQNMLQPKTRLGLEEIFSNLDVDNGDQTPAPWGPP